MLKYLGQACKRRTTIYAIIESGSKQYKVTPGQTITVERLPVTEGSTIELEKVLLLADGQDITTGTPVIEGARVLATSKGEFKDDKIIVLKYKSKVRYRRKTGHRQIYTSLLIDKILKPGEAGEAPKKPRRTRKTAAKEATDNVALTETPAKEGTEEDSSGS